MGLLLSGLRGQNGYNLNPVKFSLNCFLAALFMEIPGPVYSMLKPFKVILETLEAPWMGFMISKSLLWSLGNLDQRNVEGGL